MLKERTIEADALQETRDKVSDEKAAYNDSQSRKYISIINNPESHGMSRDIIIERLEELSYLYYCLSDEVGENGTPHTHVFVECHSPVRFSRMKKLFPSAYICSARGSAMQNRDYIRKLGKWADSEKADTKIEGSFCEKGVLPDDDSKQKMSKSERLYYMIQKGLTPSDIIALDHSFIFNLRKIEELHQRQLEKEYMKKNRLDIHRTYIYGKTGAGKSRLIQEIHGFDICRITSYREHGNGVYFDAYRGEETIVFEEFHGQIRIGDALNYLDIYPLWLPCRYADKIARYNEVFITSNLPLSQQYKDVQQKTPETWKAFLRRIDRVIEFKDDEILMTDYAQGEQTGRKKFDDRDALVKFLSTEQIG